jgi:hypothetical protein
MRAAANAGHCPRGREYEERELRQLLLEWGHPCTYAVRRLERIPFQVRENSVGIQQKPSPRAVAKSIPELHGALVSITSSKPRRRK